MMQYVRANVILNAVKIRIVREKGNWEFERED